jgi:hypothetical protein
MVKLGKVRVEEYEFARFSAVKSRTEHDGRICACTNWSHRKRELRSLICAICWYLQFKLLFLPVSPFELPFVESP